MSFDWLKNLVNAISQVSDLLGNNTADTSQQDILQNRGPYKRGRPSTQKAPHAPGEYRVRDKKTGKIIYVGETSDLSVRKSDHKRSGLYSPDEHDFEWMQANSESTSRERRSHEVSSIDRHKPPKNQRAGGAGRKPKGES